MGASAQELYASALLGGKDSLEKVDEVLENAKAAAARFKELGSGAGLSSALLCSAQAHMLKGNSYSALWDAKQGITNASNYGDDANILKGLGVLEQAGRGLDKPVQMGASVPVTMGGNMTYV